MSLPIDPEQVQSDVYLYALSCPESGEIRYIGKANDPGKRLKTHILASVRRDYPVYRWIRKLSAVGLSPVMTVLSVHSVHDWKEAEILAISRERAINSRLLNVAMGGDQPHQTHEQRQAAGRAAAAKIHGNPELRKIWEVKRNAGETLRWLKANSSPERYEKFRTTMRAAAVVAPQLFGAWSAI